MIYLDTETCGLHGLPVLLQYAIDDGPIELYSIWKNPIYQTLELIEMIVNHPGGICGFNLAFDWFHICKIYTVLSLWPNPDAFPEDIIDELGELEKDGRNGPCLKPVSACDLMLHARKGPYQSTMNRKDIRIKRVPIKIAWQLAGHLETTIKLKDIYFARRKDKSAPRWTIEDCHDADGKVSKDYKNVVMRFAPSAALKTLAADALGKSTEDILLFTSVEVDRKFWPKDYGYAPFATAVGTTGQWNDAWPQHIQRHIDHWHYNTLARKYASDDVLYTRELYEFFGKPEPGDDDSTLATMVAAVRWRGFKIDYQAIKKLKAETEQLIKQTPKAPSNVRKWIYPDLSEEERLVMGNSTKRTILEAIAKFKDECTCVDDNGRGNKDCEICSGKGLVQTKAAVKAERVLLARQAAIQVNMYDKLLLAGRLHASFKVIGTLSSRMSGADGLNPQGIKRTKDVRKCFPLALDGLYLCGGDFESFEVVIADAIFNDPKLREQLTTLVPCDDCQGTGIKKGAACKDCKGTGKTGKKIHGLFAMELFPGTTYEDVMASKGTANDMYSKGKSGVFSQMYGGDENTLRDRLGIEIEVAREAKIRWQTKYKGIGIFQKKIFDLFCSMRQTGGIGTKITWNEPADYIESLTGFRRYFTLENQICRTLFNLAENPPKEWTQIKGTVRRRDRDQTNSGATRSALFGSAFAVQSSNMRAAANHVIQSTGAVLTKKLQCKIWELQPTGISDWHVQPMNVHDEIMTPCKKELAEQLETVVRSTVDSFKNIVPLVSIDWQNFINSWADK